MGYVAAVLRPAIAALLVMACAASSGESGAGGGLAGTSPRGDACDPRGKRRVALDLNRDGKPDVVKLFGTRRQDGASVEYLACKEVDLNGDGRKDMWLHYGPDGTRTIEEMDLDFDGHVDLVSFWSGGKMVRQELDTDFDGRPDIVRYFEGDKLARVERDSNHDGRIDYREFYEGGVLDRIGYDLDGDGQVDRWERVPAPETAAAPTAASAPPAAPAKK
jgi:EF hand domain-containing protein